MITKYKPFLLVGAVFLVGYGVMYFLNRSKVHGERPADSIYYSLQERMLPSGRVLRKVVEERQGSWTKSAILLDRNGQIVQTKSVNLEPAVCKKIENGEFVQSLWADCSIEY